jgi:hypothetical protein
MFVTSGMASSARTFRVVTNSSRPVICNASTKMATGTMVLPRNRTFIQTTGSPQALMNSNA